MVEEVDTTPFGGRAAMADLADQLQLEIDELFPIAATLQLPRFAELQGRISSAAVRRYAPADVARKAMVAPALLTLAAPILAQTNAPSRSRASTSHAISNPGSMP